MEEASSVDPIEYTSALPIASRGDLGCLQMVGHRRGGSPYGGGVWVEGLGFVDAGGCLVRVVAGLADGSDVCEPVVVGSGVAFVGKSGTRTDEFLFCYASSLIRSRSLLR